MVQIIAENKKPTLSDMFGQAFAQTGQSAGQGMGQYLMGRDAQQKRAAQQQQTAQMLKQLTGHEFTGQEDPEILKALATQLMKNQGKDSLWEKKQSYLDQILNTGEQPQGQFQDQNFQEELDPAMQMRNAMQNPQGMQNQSQKVSPNKQSGYDPRKVRDETIVKAGIVDQGVGRLLESQKDRGLREDRADRKEVTDSYNESEDFRNKVYDNYEDSLRKEADIDRMLQLDESGDMSDSGVINLLETLGLQPEWLKNPANEEYNKLALDLLGGGSLQADYGSRVLASEFKVSQQRIPSLSQTSEGRRQIAENIRTMLLPSKLKYERMQFYLDKAERTGEPLPHDLRGKIMKDIKPQLEEAYDQFKQRNGRYKVREGTTPDDTAIEKYYYISDGNLIKAKKLMRDDGYDVE